MTVVRRLGGNFLNSRALVSRLSKLAKGRAVTGPVN